MIDMTQTAENLLESGSREQKDSLRTPALGFKEFLEKIERKYDSGSCRLENVLNQAKKFHDGVHLLLKFFARWWGINSQASGRTCEVYVWDDHQGEGEGWNDRSSKSMLAKAHPDALHEIKHWISIIHEGPNKISSGAKQARACWIEKCGLRLP